MKPSDILPDQHPIRVWSGVRFELIWVYDGPIHPLNRHRETDHNQGYWVWLLRQGTVEVRQEKTVLRASAGECVVPPRGFMHQHFSDDARLLSIHFNCEWPTGDTLFKERKGCAFRTADFPLFDAKARDLSQFVKAGFQSAPDVHFAQQPVEWERFLQLERHFIEWLEVFSRTLRQLGYAFTEVGVIDDRLLHAVRCLKEGALENGFPGALMLRESGLGRSQLDRLFFQAFGISTRAYWNRRKLDSANALLATTANPIKEIAFRLGFRQASHFTRWYESLMGLTPNAYRIRERIQS